MERKSTSRRRRRVAPVHKSEAKATRGREDETIRELCERANRAYWRAIYEAIGDADLAFERARREWYEALGEINSDNGSQAEDVSRRLAESLADIQGSLQKGMSEAYRDYVSAVSGAAGTAGSKAGDDKPQSAVSDAMEKQTHAQTQAQAALEEFRQRATEIQSDAATKAADGYAVLCRAVSEIAERTERGIKDAYQDYLGEITVALGKASVDGGDPTIVIPIGNMVAGTATFTAMLTSSLGAMRQQTAAD